jgi:hypothetical protein
VPRDYALDENGCWVWQRGCFGGGYGLKWVPEEKRSIGAHRWYYEQHVGPIPEGLVIDHLCRNTKCVNPDHLEAVTAAENLLRGEGICAKNARKTHCKHGHEFSPENTRITAVGSRECIQCDRRASREARARRKAKAIGSEASLVLRALSVGATHMEVDAA